ncbi:hypothetical protein Taro_043344 [Colocasia esculenta]|uniref:non-specific serine/threonine protein kinase n=1 Tax=Colocasia esculenta TaxID=4460 RepID=A0A843X3Z1_COLES|nr:hypothetical protein [Colocasia esculenta]
MKLSALFATFIFALLLELAVPDVHRRGFTFHGFRNATLSLDGAAAVTPEGLLRLTNASKTEKAHAFYPSPLRLAQTPPADNKTHYSSFSTTFVFAIVPELPLAGSHGMAFVVSSTRDLPLDSPGQYLGLFNATSDGSPSSRVVAVEFDINSSNRFGDIDSNHVGIDVNAIRSIESAPAGYFTNESSRSKQFRNLTLVSGDPMQAWVDYNGRAMQLSVTLSPLGTPRPELPLLSAAINLSTVLQDPVYVGFSSSTGKAPTSHYVLGWSFQVNGEARPLEPSSLPSLPQRGSRESSAPPYNLIKWLSIALSAVLFMAAVAGTVLFVVRRIKFAEVLEDWEVEYGPHRFSYKDLYRATKGFADREMLGCGGFGKVYKGLLPTSSTQVAVKKISHDSRQGMREFIAEIVSIGRLRHRNLVQLLGYCRRKGELLLVYDLMPGGSLDRFLFDRGGPSLSWKQRFHIVKGVASGLLYLHEGWEQVVIHRDIKASNVLLDGDFSGRLGDFGLARLYDHGSGLQTTHVVGTMGYLGPELVRTGKATKATDVFAFGAFLLEVASGRRPIERQRPSRENFVLVDWVLDKWRRGSILEAADARVLGGDDCATEEVLLVMMLGLHCSHPLPSGRPSMRQVMQFLEGDAPLPELPLDYMNPSFPAEQQEPQQQQQEEGCCPGFHMSYPSYTCTTATLSGPR